jgi:hypothetical protein
MFSVSTRRFIFLFMRESYAAKVNKVPKKS